MATELQRIIDSLSHRVARSAGIDDDGFGLVAYGAFAETGDEVRAASILARATPPKVVAWLRDHGVDEATEPVRLPASAELGLHSRLYIPIRIEEQRLGYLWLVDPDESLDANGHRLARIAAADAAIWLLREHLTTELRLSREREVLRDLIDEDDRLRRQAVERVLESDLLIRPGRVDAIVAFPRSPHTTEPPQEVRRAMTAALEEGRKIASPRHALELVRPDHAIFVMVTSDVEANTNALRRLAQRMHERLSRLLAGCPGWSSYVGISARQTRLDQVHIAYREALWAAHAAGQIEALGPVASWSHLGIYRLLMQMPLEGLDLSESVDAAYAFVRDEGNAELVDTLEVFLDRAGDIKETAALLHVHRGTVYYRLRRAEERLGASLRDGEVRLTLHLLIKILRLDRTFPAE